MFCCRDLKELTILRRHQQIAGGSLLQIHLLSGLHAWRSRKDDQDLGESLGQDLGRDLGQDLGPGIGQDLGQNLGLDHG